MTISLSNCVFHKSWQERALEAEAKLAELEKQHINTLDLLSGCNIARKRLTESLDEVRLYRPALAVSLAELVPCEGFLEQTSDESIITWQRGWDACRAEILRNIEKANK